MRYFIISTVGSEKNFNCSFSKKEKRKPHKTSMIELNQDVNAPSVCQVHIHT